MNEIENGTYEQSIEASMTIVATYLQKLKDSGVYDNTAIMILSDHGYNIEDDDSSEKRQHPILFVKGVDEHYDEPTHFYEYMQTGYAGDVDTMMYFTGVEITP